MGREGIHESGRNTKGRLIKVRGESTGQSPLETTANYCLYLILKSVWSHTQPPPVPVKIAAHGVPGAVAIGVLAQTAQAWHPTCKVCAMLTCTTYSKHSPHHLLPCLTDQLLRPKFTVSTLGILTVSCLWKRDCNKQNPCSHRVYVFLCVLQWGWGERGTENKKKYRVG